MKDQFQVMPNLSEEEYEALKADVAGRGVVVPVVLDEEGNILDGHHRARAVEELREEGRDVPDYPREIREDLENDADKRDLAWRLNMQRRHLSQADKREAIATKLKETPGWSNNRVAKLLGVSDHTVRSERLRLEGTSQISRLDALEGEDGKKRRRNPENDLAREFEKTQRGQVRSALLKDNGFLTDEQIAKRVGVEPETVAEQRYDLATHGARSADTDLKHASMYGRDALSKMARRTSPRSPGKAAESVRKAIENRILQDFLYAIRGRRIDAEVTPAEVWAAWRGPFLKASAEEIKFAGEWLVEFAELLEEERR